MIDEKVVRICQMMKDENNEVFIIDEPITVLQKNLICDLAGFSHHELLSPNVHRFAKNCNVDGLTSRICSFGTKGCKIKH